MSPELLQDHVKEIRTLLEARLRIRGRTLGHQLRKAGRLLPRNVRRDAQFLAQAVVLVQNPKLSRMVDATRVEKAYANVTAFLEGIDAADRLKGRLLSVLGSIAFAIIVVFIGVVWVLVNRGIV